MQALPHEGLTVEALGASLRGTALQPLITAPLLYALINHQNLIPADLLSKINIKVAIKVLKALLTLGVLRTTNNTFSKQVLNNWTTSQWRHGEEVVVVTGGSSGIGELVVKGLASRSKAVIILDVGEPKADLPSNVTFYKVDIRSSKEIATAASAIRTAFGDPTVLVNNAGVGSPFTILASDEASIRRVLDINLVSHFLTVKEFLPAMVKADHGHVVTIASLASFMAIAPTAVYSCSKAGVLAFHEALSNELKVRYDAPRVRTTVVHPGFVRTPLVTRMLENKRFKGFVLEPQTVADALIKNLLAGNSGQIILPGRDIFWSFLRTFPYWLQYGLRNLKGNEIKKIQGQ